MRRKEDLLQDLLTLVVNSYGAYMMTAAAMPCYDDADKKLMALFKELSVREKSYVERAYDAVFSAGLRPATRAVPLHFAQLNFCRPTQVASRWMTESSREASEGRTLLAAMKASPDSGALTQAIRLCEDVIALREESGRLVAKRYDDVKPKVAAAAAPAAKPAGAAAAKPAASMPPPPGAAGMPKPPGASMPPPPGAPAMPKPPGAAMPPPPAGAPAMPRPPSGPAVMPKPPVMPPPPKS